jgi:hypothetical protein
VHDAGRSPRRRSERGARLRPTRLTVADAGGRPLAPRAAFPPERSLGVTTPTCTPSAAPIPRPLRARPPIYCAHARGSVRALDVDGARRHDHGMPGPGW